MMKLKIETEEDRINEDFYGLEETRRHYKRILGSLAGGMKI